MPKLLAKRLLLVHAHPDDEAIYTAHLIAQTVAQGGEVLIVTLTRGERGKTQVPELAALNGDPLAMADYRENELRNSATILGAQFQVLGTRAYKDTGMRINGLGKPSRPRRISEQSLVSASIKVVSGELVKVLKEFRPDTVVTYNSRGGFGHPDHKATHHATVLALRQYRPKGRPPKFWVIAEPGERFDAEISGAETAEQKRLALQAHRSQVLVQGDEYSFARDELHRVDAPERFRLTSPTPIVALRPLLTFFWAIPLGALVAIAGTLLHQTTLVSGAQIGLWVSLAMVGSLALALRMLRNSRGALYLMSASLAGTIFWLSQNNESGEILIPGNLNGLIWAYGSIGVCFVIMLFPRLARRNWSSRLPQ